MNKCSLALAIAFSLSLASNTIAQTTSVAITNPCVDEPASGQATLKRRVPRQDDQPAPANDSTAETNQRPTSKPRTIRFEGLTAVSESDLRRFICENRIALPENAQTDNEFIAKAEATIREFLRARGYRHADVSSRLDRSDKEASVLTFVVSEGPRIGISEIRFYGNHVFSSQLLVTETKACLARYHEDEPDRFDSYVFEYCLHRLANFERSQGYLQSKFAEPKLEEVGGGLIITIHADEGIRYRVGGIEIEGADHVAEQEIRAMLDLRSGDVVDGEKIAKTMYEDLKAVYGNKGFIQYTAEIEPEFHSATGAGDGLVDFKITIDEGRRFRIRKISFKGDNLPENELRQLLLLRAGDVYNQRLFAQSVRNINETGWFNLVDKDKDVDYRTNEEESLVDIVIKLTKRESRDASRSDN